ncbi:J domain-containing protein [Myxacorys almedinensis]|uniref:DnaJ domain-containing protein n=1 Tax=Myxacorys almedinensis A TaxID=2690445 RepID=A0A8J7Z031_9CYAN|nr:DnaJ domain-containing protein [Myxacorys almedinensis]NDJ17772.1 DnaJ domain-containing protein [Myxacorys almedinensis A]
MAISTHYQTLDLQPTASPAEIKQAYRRLAKRFHPDTKTETADPDRISQINAAYEILGDPQNRQQYDQHLQLTEELEAAGFSVDGAAARRHRTEAAQARYRKQRAAEQDADNQLDLWLRRVYTPVNRMLNQILRPLKSQINALSRDPFDDDLMHAFQVYLEECKQWIDKGQKTFQALPNPPSAAAVAANLYHCLNQLSDGIVELEYFTLNYNDYHIHTGRELFRIAERLRRDAIAAVRELP